jgi:transcriptional regulator with XRE-family HTH domain
MPERVPTNHEVDAHVSQRVRQQRILLGLSQEQLGDRIGARYQMVHKYESAAVRMSAGMLCQVAVALDVNVAHFYQAFSERNESHADQPAVGAEQRRLPELCRNFANIRSVKGREALLQFARNLAGDERGDDREEKAE